MEQRTNVAKSNKLAFGIVGIIVVLLLVIIVVVVLRQPSKTNSAMGGMSPSSQTLTRGGSGSGGQCANGQSKMALNIGGQMIESCGVPTVGTAAAVDATSLTVTADSGGQKTFKASAQTKVISGDSTVPLSTIKVSDKVIAIPSSDDPNTVAYVLLNPDIQSGGGGLTTGTN